jgi:hypothetical protein
LFLLGLQQGKVLRAATASMPARNSKPARKQQQHTQKAGNEFHSNKKTRTGP